MTEEQSVEYKFVSLTSRTKWVSILLCLNITLSLADIHYGISQYFLYSKFRDGSFYPQSEVTNLEKIAKFIVPISFLIFVMTAILFLIWIRRAYINLKSLGIENLEYSPKWTIWGFFIPFINIVRPYQIMKEIWLSSTPKDEEEGVLFKNYSPSTILLLAWWITWLVSNGMANVYSKLSQKAESIESIMSSTQFGIVSDITNIAAAILCLFVVNEIKSRQEQRFAQITSM